MEEELQVFPVSISVAMSVLRLVLDCEKKDNYDEKQMEYVDSQEGEPEENEEDNCKT